MLPGTASQRRAGRRQRFTRETATDFSETGPRKMANEQASPAAAVGPSLTAETLRSLITHDIVSPLQQLPVLIDFVANPAHASAELGDDMRSAMQGLLSRVTVAAEELAQLVDGRDRQINPFRPGEGPQTLTEALSELYHEGATEVRVEGDIGVALNIGRSDLRCLLRATVGELMANPLAHSVAGTAVRLETSGLRLSLRSLDAAQRPLRHEVANPRLVMRGELGTYGWGYVSRIAARDGVAAEVSPDVGIELVLPLAAS